MSHYHVSSGGSHTMRAGLCTRMFFSIYKFNTDFERAVEITCMNTKLPNFKLSAYDKQVLKRHFKIEIKDL